MVKFSKLVLDTNGKPEETAIREIAQSDIMKCPHFILAQEHYRNDGSCRCDDPSHIEMKEWEYTWNEAMRRWE